MSFPETQQVLYPFKNHSIQNIFPAGPGIFFLVCFGFFMSENSVLNVFDVHADIKGLI